jgi:metal-responsive CopG/Arc/MetJ family transcriptional regulator
MGSSKIVISLDESILNRLDRLVHKQLFLSRSQVIQEAIEEKVGRLKSSRRLAQECAKLDPAFENALAEGSLPQALEEWTTK